MSGSDLIGPFAGPCTRFGRRVWTSEDAARWLLTPEMSAPSGAPDANECARLALRLWQLLPLTAPRVQHGLPDGGVDSTLLERVLARATAVRVFTTLQLRYLDRAAAAFGEAGVDFRLLKGTASRFLGYDSPALRAGVDIDVGVPPRDLDRAVEVVRSLGFIPAEFDPATGLFSSADPTLRSAVEARHYELGFWVRRLVIEDLTEEETRAIRADDAPPRLWHQTPDGAWSCYISLDLHHGLSLDIPIVECLQEPPRIHHGLPLLSLPWLLTHYVYKIYWEGSQTYATGGHQYADLARLAPMLTAAHTEALLHLLQKHELEAAGFYVLRRVREFGVVCDALDDLLDRLSRVPREVPPLSRGDWGDMWDKLWARER